MQDWIWLALSGVVLLTVLIAGAVAYARRMALPPPSEPTAIPAAPSPADRFAAALQRTRDALGGTLRAVFGREHADEEAYEGLEEALLRADVGTRATSALLDELRKRVPKDAPGSALRRELRALVRERLERHSTALATVPSGPLVILVVGVNGSGKTTTIGKLAARYRKEGRTVLLGAGDTFRAGAIEQLKVWGERADAPVIAQQEGADPAAVCHDTLQAAVARNIDVVICDTAGRLQAQKALMDELAKVRKVIGRIVPGAPHETLLVLDGTMGQNAFSQARVFKDVAGVTGVALTKLDGTAKGGVVIGISEEFELPVKLVGVGEKVEDLRTFDPAAFAGALFPDVD
ncbi:MAG: signal recognition particle-docking protein FtsY [Pseudomonadota bacterium]|nr:signal recognition particle-docking protein FtsY [Pseudomonadota bacterium]